MTCASCSSHVEKAVSKLNGVSKVTVNLLQNFMVVEYDETAVSETDIIKAVTDAGYGAFPADSKSRSGKTPAGQIGQTGQIENAGQNPAAAEAEQMKFRLIWSIILLIPLMYIAMGPMIGLPLPSFLSGHENAVAFGMAQLLLALAIAYLNRNYFINGFKSLIKRAPTMDALIAIGSSAAIIYGIYAIVRMGYGLAIQDFALVEQYHMDMYFESAGTILTLITVGKYLESRSKGKTSDAITRLLDLAPKTALVEKDGAEVEIPVADVAPGDVLIVKTGNSIPVDGRIIEGSAAIDESAITGESIPVEKTIGDNVTGATVNRSGFIKMTAVRVGEDTTLSQIIRLVEEASASKAPISKLADRVSAIFVPAVILIAIIATIAWLLLGYPFEFALSIGIAVLVISCPCALGLATPTAIMVGTGKGAENGILFRNAESIETAQTVNVVILDKTGTVTEGKPSVTGIYPAAGFSKEELMTYAASVEKFSEHPLAVAIVEKAAAMNLNLMPAADFKQTAGHGIQAVIQNQNQNQNEEILAGNAKMMIADSIDIQNLSGISDEIAENGQTPLYFAKNKQLLGIVSIADIIKPTSKRAIAEFKNMGIDVILLTGDNEKTANAIAKQLEIDHVIAGVLPEGKEQIVRKQQETGKKVAMIGDGINDAPALARADVGMAIGAGTDIAIESADIVLMKSDLMDAVTAFKLSKATIRNIKENLFWAFFYNILGIPLAAGMFYPILGWKLNPMFAAAAMSLSSLFVVTNALRLRFFKPKFTTAAPPEACPLPAEADTATADGAAGSVAAAVGTAAVGTAAGSAAADSSGAPAKTVPENKDENKNEGTVLMKINGMTCINCQKHVEKALNAIPGVSAAVDWEAGTARISGAKEVSDEILKQAVEKEGYEVVSIQRE
ncbi:Copper-exporting P-type ATPase [Methanimicrococcus sp. At1]|uniref:Copper-exporting P-type ATPase n=2 Tax=Methanimicrococcus hacksteinii TaxID=3028293 RepID=A0ABU3VQ06_9EURY|nr:Copper-exporting P-type ATPase [Methanimicrococcus sp. At1]